MFYTLQTSKMSHLKVNWVRLINEYYPAETFQFGSHGGWHGAKKGIGN